MYPPHQAFLLHLSTPLIPHLEVTGNVEGKHVVMLTVAAVVRRVPIAPMLAMVVAAMLMEWEVEGLNKGDGALDRLVGLVRASKVTHEVLGFELEGGKGDVLNDVGHPAQEADSVQECTHGAGHSQEVPSVILSKKTK